MWLRSDRVQRLGGGFGERFGIGLISQLNLLFLNAHKDQKVVRLIRQVRRERQSMLTAFESFNVYSFVRSRNNLPGDMAEVEV